MYNISLIFINSTVFISPLFVLDFILLINIFNSFPNIIINSIQSMVGKFDSINGEERQRIYIYSLHRKIFHIQQYSTYLEIYCKKKQYFGTSYLPQISYQKS